MKKALIGIFTVLSALGLICQAVWAGGVDNKQNFSTRYLATGSRNAAIDGVDIAAYNPAGIMQQKNGFAVEADIQYILKEYTHNYTNVNPAGPVSRDQDKPSAVPSLFATYKTDNWGAFGSVTVNGGGGTVDFKSGNAITNDVETLLIATYGAAGVTGNESILAKSYYLTYTVGTSYKLNDMFSFAAGIRYIDASKEIDAYATSAGVGNLLAAYEEEAEGWGWVASANIKPNNDFLIAVRYESRVDLEFETKFDSKTNALGTAILAGLGKTDNGKGDRDLPGVLGVGVLWKASDDLSVTTSYTLYFEEDADWDGQEDKVNNSYEIGVSFTYNILDTLRVSLGYLYTDVGLDAKDFDLISKMSPALDAHSFLSGIGYDFNDSFTVELGLMWNYYEADKNNTANVEYKKSNAAAALGLVYRF